MLVAGYDSKQASKQLGRILNDPKRERLKSSIGPPIRVNGAGYPTYGATGQQMHRVLMCLPPGRFTDEYMDECARVLFMRDIGDPRLIAEVQHNRAATIANGGVPRMDSLFGPSSAPGVTHEVLPSANPELVAASNKRAIAMMEAEVRGAQLALAERRYALEERRQDHAMRMCRGIEEVKAANTQNAHEAKSVLEEMGAFDDHSRWALRDQIHNFDPGQYIALACRAPILAAPAPLGAAAAEKGHDDHPLRAAVQIDVQAGYGGPMHAQPSNLLQVHEILELRMGVGASEAARVSTAFGRVIAPMYRDRYKVADPPKKNREIKGLVKPVNAYPPADWAWIEPRLAKLLAADRAEQARTTPAPPYNEKPSKKRKHK